MRQREGRRCLRKLCRAGVHPFARPHDGAVGRVALAADQHRSSLNRLIVDRTGLEGQYDVTLKFTPDNIPGGNVPGFPSVDPNGPSIFTALQERLGLKLDAQRAPVNVLVVDRAERPTEN